MLPPRSEVRVHLARLLSGEESPGSAADWASEKINFYEMNRTPGRPGWDRVVWDALELLQGADLKVSHTDYLHGEEDFRAWLEEFDRSDPGAQEYAE
jgi:hypothetical protein